MFTVNFVSVGIGSLVSFDFETAEKALSFIERNKSMWVDFFVELDGEMLDTAEFVFNKKVVVW